MAFDGTLKFDTSIDKSGFESGLSKLGGIAKAGMAAVTGAITAASGAMAALGTKALEAYADYEQLTGGVETLFGDVSGTIRAIGQQALDDLSDDVWEKLGQQVYDNAGAFKEWENDVGSSMDAVADAMTYGIGTASADVDGYIKYLTDSYQMNAEDAQSMADAVSAAISSNIDDLGGYAEAMGHLPDAAKMVAENAARAFRTAGLSQNEYMETVTSFSAALIASLDGGTAKAAQVADKAIIDMADNANKMGSSMESIQNAYQGFAKQNYTMLDNLKLGYGGTKEEMERLLIDAEKISGIEYNLDSYADIVEAIHVVQTEMHISGISAEEAAELVASGALTEEEAFARMGTTAKEASTTIQGSVSMTKAAFSNLLVGIADDTQDFDKLVDDLVESATAAAGNILPRVETVIGGLGKLISSMSGVAAELLVSLLGYVPELISAGSALINAVVDGLAQNAPAVERAALDAISMLLLSIIDMAPDILSLISNLMSRLLADLTRYLPTFADAAIELGLAFLEGISSIDSSLIGFGAQLITTLAESITEHIPEIIRTAKSIITQITDALVTNIPLVADAAVQVIGALLEALLDPGVLTAVLGAALQIILTLTQALLDNIPQIIEIISTLITNVIDFIVAAVPMLLDAAVQLFMAIVDALPQIIDALTKELPKILDAVVGLIPQIVQAIATALPQIISTITQAIPVVIQTLAKAMPQIIIALIDALLSSSTQLLDAAIQLLYAIIDALPVITEALMEAMPAIIEAIIALLIEAAPQILEASFTMFMALVGALPEVIAKLVEYFGEMFSLVDEWIDEIFSNAADAVASWFGKMIEDAKQAASNLVAGAMQFLDELPGKIGYMLGSAIGHIVQFAQEAPERAKEAASEFLDNVVEFFRELPGKAKEWLDNTIEKVVSWASDLARKGKDGADDLVRKVVDGISVLPQKMFDAGRNLVEGLWNGITGMGNWLRDKISGFAGGIISVFKDVFGIESPSKVMRDSVGKYLAQGIGVGFTEEIPQIGKDALEAFSNLKLPDIDMNINADIPKLKAPRIDPETVNLIQSFNERPDADLIQPSPTSEITNNYYSSTTNNSTIDTQPIINVHVHCNTEMDGEKVAEMVAEKVDILQGETVEMDERGTAH